MARRGRREKASNWIVDNLLPLTSPSRYYSIGKFFTKSYKFNFFESFGLLIICCPSPTHHSPGKICENQIFFESYLFVLNSLPSRPPVATTDLEQISPNQIFIESNWIVNNLLHLFSILHLKKKYVDVDPFHQKVNYGSK